MNALVERPASTSRRVPAAVLWGGLTVLAAVGCWYLVQALADGLSGGRDFVQDYAAVVKIGQGRQPYEPYNDVTEELFGGPPHKGPLYSFHAPSALPPLIWLLPVALAGGYTAAFLAWAAVSLASLAAIVWLTLRATGVRRAALAGVLSALALIALPPIRANFDEGQLNVAVAAGMVGCWAARRAGRSGLAGVLLGAAFALKPIPGLFFLYYLWRRDWPLLASAAATLVVLSLAGLAMSGLDGAWLWATVNYPSHASVWPGYPDNASVRGFFTRLFGPSEWRPRPPYPLPYASMLLWAASGAVLTLFAMVAILPKRSVRALVAPAPIPRDSSQADLEVAALTVLSMLVTPILWPHYYVVLVMPVIVVAVTLWRRAIDGRRLPPILALGALGVGVLVLSTAHYVEPYAGVGGQQLFALLLIYVASLAALWWAARDQGGGISPEAAR